MNATPIKLSVLIPTVGRRETLFNTVNSLMPQLLPDEEIIIIDQNRPALTWPENLAKDTRLHFAQLTRPGLTRARNVGLKLAQHDHAVFLDDDIIPDPALLEHLRLAATRHPKAVWTGTITQNDTLSTEVKQGGPENFGVGWVDLDSGSIVTDYTNPPEGEVPFFAGGLCLLPLQVTGRKSLYARAFRGAAQGEEIDLALRLQRRGIPILSDPTIRMHHLKAQEGGCRSEAHRVRFACDEAFNRGFFWGRHGRLIAWLAWYRRQKGFIEFHSRKASVPSDKGPRPPYRHDWGQALWLAGQAVWGLLHGLVTRHRV